MSDAIFRARAPGRVNLIGEHTDYNGGMVLPAALSVGLEVTLAPRTDDQVLIRSAGYPDAQRPLESSANGEWSDPVLGALREARRLKLIKNGAEISITSTIPAGSGLSSSAALIVAILKAARESASSGHSDVDLAVAARRVENEYMGVPCGIMDQMAVALASPGTAMALDTKTLAYSLVDLPEEYEFIVIHSGLARKLTDGRYAQRKAECDEAKAYLKTNDLCLLDPAEIAASNLPDPARKRALHCATEHRRVVEAVAAIETGDIAALGEIMNASHISMRDNFEMSLPQIDALVSDAVRLGAVGARLTGGGFGGCIVACIEKGRSAQCLEKLLSKHPEAKLIDRVGV